MKKIVPIASIILLIALLPCVNSLYAQSDFKITNRIHLEGDFGWDYLTVDAANNRVFVSHGQNVQVIDLNNTKEISTIPATSNVHGIALAPDLNKGFISCGRDSSVVVFDYRTLRVTDHIKVPGKNPDAILYEPYKKVIFTFNGGSANATVIDASTNKVLQNIALAGKPEFAASDGEGKVYVNIEDKSLVTVINTNTFKVENTWPLKPGEEPSGLAFDKTDHHLFIVCSNKMMVVMDALTGKVITTLAIGDHCDGVAYDQGLKRAYSSNGDGTMTVVQESDNNVFKVIENVVTQKGARTITCNPLTHKLYLSTADLEESTGGGRPKPKPGTFTILEIEKVK